jgi:hypothetical protein
MKKNLLRCGVFLALVSATWVGAELYRIPARPVREMLAAQHIPLYSIPIQVAQAAPQIPTRRQVTTATAPSSDCIFTITPTSITFPYTGGTGIITVTARRTAPTSLVLEPMTNGCMSVMVTNADPAVVWTIQRSFDLVAWTDGMVLTNSSYYQWAECFPTNSDHLFLRLIEP